ncbi:NAD(P)-binding protein [Trichoderma citrinoviride]|uniref:NAD(P)-binding protein n=1 Tax=Trichoderma citrinoviride TaxID=58853 RepID=A0A2T4B8L6_9HYPO|nr:NAD(P)-binding protein [Trichoderma citrinoviride]PTB65677.1 NAD(P)-binding protein [Trichoderma citrinoviride]
MATVLKNIALVGASGNVGKVLLPALLAANKFTVTVLRRRASSPSTLPSGVRVVDVDFSSADSLAAALAGQDALVSTVGSGALNDEQKRLIDAAVAAGVRRFLPSEYGCDLQNELAAKLPVFAHKVEVAGYLEDKARTTPLTYTLVYSGPFFDWGLQHNFIFKSAGSRPLLYDGGSTVFSTSTLDAVAQAVVGVLSKPEETRNRAVRFQSVAISQAQLLAIAKEVAPERDWQPEVVKLDDITKAADERLAKGLFDQETFTPYILRAINDERYGPKFEKLDNELLGVKQLTEEEVKAIVKEKLSD